MNSRDRACGSGLVTVSCVSVGRPGSSSVRSKQQVFDRCLRFGASQLLAPIVKSGRDRPQDSGVKSEASDEEVASEVSDSEPAAKRRRGAKATKRTRSKKNSTKQPHSEDESNPEVRSSAEGSGSESPLKKRRGRAKGGAASSARKRTVASSSTKASASAVKLSEKCVCKSCGQNPADSTLKKFLCRSLCDARTCRGVIKQGRSIVNSLG